MATVSIAKSIANQCGRFTNRPYLFIASNATPSSSLCDAIVIETDEPV
jgi:hypothetical protein